MTVTTEAQRPPALRASVPGIAFPPGLKAGIPCEDQGWKTRRETVLTEQPPLSLEKLEAIVRDPTWTARIDEREASRAATEIVPYTDQRVASAASTP
ncbi:hypothetical protein OG871_37800 [Kitasatospora sp. NBC_00374]|uniref:hypothetical protein n=1 Tax=Kitasatospora sp. NBC_00374 TaxID=2975964 RepID=UPI0030DF2C55